ncbi:head decoration protein [Desulfobulbus elongatus]|uniref:head decoration protein n=1 Tax=Desulfobulbus elongatus TaxID=53332 RepID=UPI0004858081|nr:head decoration protein [Desulfobulbus elongatus]
MPEYTPDNLLAGNEFPALVTAVTIKSGQNLQRGAVLGEITATGKYQLVDKTAEDGSQTAKHILAADVDATAADAPGVVYDTGIFNPAALILAAGTVVADVSAALRSRSIFLRAVRTL